MGTDEADGDAFEKATASNRSDSFETVGNSGVTETAIDSDGLGGYQIIREIGRGGMGVVYEARQIRLDRSVALKMILSGEFASEEDIHRFYAEAKAAACLQHPGIVAVYDVNESQGRHYIAMELIQGESLQARIGSQPLDVRLAVKVTRDIALALAEAHRHDIVHRDIKPDNILIDANNHSKITDFGLAQTQLAGSFQTQKGEIIGTPSFMPPEQAKGKSDRIDKLADIYSLGAVLYTCVTGRPPFVSSSISDTLRQVIEDPPVAPSCLNRSVDEDLDAIVLKCLEKTPQARYSTAEELVASLDAWLEKDSLAMSLPPRHSERARPPFWAMLFVGCLVAMGLIAAVSIGLNNPDPYREMRQQEVQRIVNRFLQNPSDYLSEPSVGRVFVPALTPPDPAAFETISRLHIYDFSHWRPYDPDKTGEPYSPVTLIKQQRLRKLKPVEEIRVESRTSGYDVYQTCEDCPGPAYEVGEDSLVQVGGQTMKARQLVVDVSEVEVDSEFDLDIRCTFWNAFEKEDQRWVGVMIRDRPFKVSFLIIFREDQTVQKYKLRVADIDGQNIRDYEGEQLLIEGDGGRFLFWEIMNPQPQHVYRIDWE